MRKKKVKQFFERAVDLLLLIALAVFLASCRGEKEEKEEKEEAKPEASKTDYFIKAAKDFVKLLEKRDFSRAVRCFDSTMKSAMPKEKLIATWDTVLAKAGPFKKQVAANKLKHQQFEVVFVTCEFERATLNVQVVLNSEKKVSGLFFRFRPGLLSAAYQPPMYAQPESFREKDVVVGTGRWALPGTLTIPKGDGPFSVVVLVHGSGPHNRDETVGPNKPFRDLAWGLASRKIAVLRYEKRTKEHAIKLLSIKENITVKDEVIDDVLAAVSLLRGMDEIDPNRILVLGHSLGGTLIPRIGMLNKNIAGFIIMAGSTRPLEDLYLEQVRYIFSLDGTISDEERKQLELIEKQVAKVKDPALTSAVPATELPLGVPAKYWLDLREYDPPEVVKKLDQPMLVLQGGRDYQVTSEDFEGWKRALGSRKNVKFKFYPKLNHLFMKGEGKSTPAEYEVPSNVAEKVIDDIAEWIKAVSAR